MMSDVRFKDTEVLLNRNRPLTTNLELITHHSLPTTHNSRL